MSLPLAIVLAYLVVTLLVGLLFRKAVSRDRVQFYLAGRSLSGLLLFFTMAATNFSAFTIFGLSGAGYRTGYAFWPIMAFGTGFMALSFWVIGRPIRRLSRERGWITPSDFIGDRYRSPALKRLFSLVLILLTLPYISIQTVAAGRSLASLLGLPYLTGAVLITGFVILYVALGGMHSVAWTDVIQALMMIGFTLAAFWIIAAAGGGFVPLHGRIRQELPGLLARPGLDGSLLPGVWLGLPGAVAGGRPDVPPALPALPGRPRRADPEDHHRALPADHHRPVLPHRVHRRHGPLAPPGARPGARRRTCSRCC